jgi:energy-coupling factor transport system ATP-binding protein
VITLTPLLEATIRRFRYQRSPTDCLRDVYLRVHEGEFVAIAGASGAGKSTLCFCLAGVIPHFVGGHYEGEVKVRGQSLTALRLPEIARLLGFVRQAPENQLFCLTVAGDVAFGPENLGLPRQEISRRVAESLQATGLTCLADRAPSSLSGGEAQRAVLAAVLAMDPALLIMDQPAAELDPLARQHLYRYLHRLNKETGKAILVVEERLEDVMPYASRVICLQHGKLSRDCAPQQLLDDESLFDTGLRLPDAARLYHLLAAQGVRPPRVFYPGADVIDSYRSWLAGRGVPRFTPSADHGIEALPSASRPPSAASVDIRHLFYRYPHGAWVLEDISLQVRRGEFVSLVGENGAGKSTLAKMLIGLLRPTKGEVWIDGQSTAQQTVAQLSARVGFLFQDPDQQVFRDSVYDEVAVGLKLRGLSKGAVEQTTLAVLEWLSLSDWAEVHPYALSRGQRQRLALATILARRPSVLVMDEPLTGLDFQEIKSVMDSLLAFCRQGGTVLMVTHDLAVASEYSHRIVALAGGSVKVDTLAHPPEQRIAALREAGVSLPVLCQLAETFGLPLDQSGVHTFAKYVSALASGDGPPAASCTKSRLWDKEVSAR